MCNGMTPLTRAAIAAVTKSLTTSIAGGDETMMRLHMLSLALSPTFSAIDRAIGARAGDLPTTAKEVVATYLAGAIERKLVHGPDAIVLHELARDPADLNGSGSLIGQRSLKVPAWAAGLESDEWIELGANSSGLRGTR